MSSGIILLTLGTVLVTVLLIAYGSGEHSAQLEAIKTAGTIVLGTGGAAALWLTARRQRSAEIALNQKHLDQVAVDRAFTLQQQTVADNHQHQERVAAATEHDADQRRLSELYLKAVEQLGSDKAAVRHGGLYALERVAQDNPNQRQTVVNVLCAYLRGPYQAPGVSAGRRLGVRRPLLASTRDRAVVMPSATDAKPVPSVHSDTYSQLVQEREVRLTAQRILETHLKPGSERANPALNFWPDINLDLTGAVLSDLDLRGCRVKNARFDKAVLSEGANFTDATFSGYAWFTNARFTGNAWFRNTEFADHADFTSAKFAENTWFEQ
ncbi:MAG TPA: pentapeptide repeat-containing protein, partial [Nonomuraea sp.]|nr:pentapeptide repeat-containing protein [Nonomuraea sp.]